MKWKPDDIKRDGFGNTLWAGRDGLVWFKPYHDHPDVIGALTEEKELLVCTDVRDLTKDQAVISELLMALPVDVVVIQDKNLAVSVAVSRHDISEYGKVERTLHGWSVIRVPPKFWRKL